MAATVLSCFSGVGGLDLGLETAGFETIGCLETDADAREALISNRANWPLLDPADVVAAGANLGPRDLGLNRGDLTLIAGGPPCQPFSKAAQWVSSKKGITDERGTAVDGMLGLIATFLPRAVLMENVSGFLSGPRNASHRIAEAFDRINASEGTNYALHSWVVDAADYGVPQRRRRAIVLAFREQVVVPDELPVTHAGSWRTAWDALGDAAPDEAVTPSGRYADLLPCIPEGDNYQYLTARGGGRDVELFGYRTRFWSFLLKLAKDQPSWTLPASPGPSTGPFHWDDRPLTSNERMLLQGFPDTWKLTARERANVRLAGNATPPPLAEAMGRYVLATLETPTRIPAPEVIEAQLATPVREEPPPPARKPAALPEGWLTQVCPRDSHPGQGEGPGAQRAVEVAART